MKTAVVFLSMKGETIAPGMKIVNLEKGYTNIMAEYIEEVLHNDLVEIVPERIYSTDHFQMIQEAKEEFEKNDRPAIQPINADIPSCEMVFLGFPNWWATMPMPVFTFLEQYDWTGKKIVPFVTSGGSGFAHALEDLKKTCSKAEILEGLAVLGHEVENEKKKIQDWAWRVYQEEEMKKNLNDFDSFKNEDALNFGLKVCEIAEREYKRPVRIRVVYDDVIVFQYFTGDLVGGEWLDKKEKTVKKTGKSSICTYYHPEEFKEIQGDDSCAMFGGGVPYLINGENHGAFIVSGLRHREDHDLVMKALESIKKN